MDDAGNLKAVSVGTATITAVQKDADAQLDIEVLSIPVERIDLSFGPGHEGKLEVDDSTQLIADIFPENATYRDISWTSSAPDVAVVDENGLVTAVSSGSAEIKAVSTDGIEAVIQVRVASQSSPVMFVGVAVVIVAAGVFIRGQVKKRKVT